MRYPTYIKNCITLLEKSGYRAYAVGGAVRDSLLGKEPFDWDVTTSATPDEILSVFEDYKTIPTGIKHGTVTVLCDDNDKKATVEITTFRIDGEYGDSRHPKEVHFSNELQDDLSRRDFTVNAMAFNEKEGIIDVFEGKKDLENHIIRAVGDPEKRFSEDALRILRAFRFSAQLGFTIEEKTLLGIKKCAHLLHKISRERIGIEFKRLLASSGVEYALQNMVELDVWQNIFDVPCPSARMISKLPSLNDNRFAVRLAAIASEYTDAEKEMFLASLRLSNAEKRLIYRLCGVKNFQIPENREKYPFAARHFLHLYNNICDNAIEMLALFNEGDLVDFTLAIELEKSGDNPLTVSDLAVKGDDILPLCNGDFSKVGKTLAILLRRVWENPSLNNREQLIEIARKELE